MCMHEITSNINNHIQLTEFKADGILFDKFESLSARKKSRLDKILIEKKEAAS